MVKQVITRVVDDLDDQFEADETVGYSLDGVDYEVDLTAENARNLRRTLEPWITVSRRKGGRRTRVTTSSRRNSNGELTTAERAKLRAWAMKNGSRIIGKQVSDRGRIAGEIMTAWNRAGRPDA